MPKNHYSRKDKEGLFQALHGYLAQAPKQFERAEHYLTAHPRATAQELERAGFSKLLEKAGYSPNILRDYLGIETPKKPVKINRQFLRGTNTDVLLEAHFQQKVINKLVDYRKENTNEFISVADYLAKEYYQGRKSLREIAKETDISNITLAKIFKTYNFPIRPNAEATREMLGERWKDKGFRKRYAEAVREMLRERWKDKGFRKRNAEAVRENWKDEGFRKRQAEAAREMLRERWKDKGFRKRQAEAVRKARKSYIEFEPEYQEDLGRYTASEVEANIERAIKHTGRQYEIRYFRTDANAKNHRNKIPIYFLTTSPSPRENKVAYVLINKPYKKTFSRIEEFASQGIRVRIANERFYRTLERIMGEKIDNWEKE